MVYYQHARFDPAFTALAGPNAVRQHGPAGPREPACRQSVPAMKHLGVLARLGTIERVKTARTMFTAASSRADVKRHALAARMSAPGLTLEHLAEEKQWSPSQSSRKDRLKAPLAHFFSAWADPQRLVGSIGPTGEREKQHSPNAPHPAEKQVPMKKFLVIYRAIEAALEKVSVGRMDEAARKDRQRSGLEAWEKWGSEHANAIVDQGTPIGKTKRVDRTGISNIKNAVTGYVIVEAESLEAAATLFADHPHFKIFPGDAIEVRECLNLAELLARDK